MAKKYRVHLNRSIDFTGNENEIALIFVAAENFCCKQHHPVLKTGHIHLIPEFFNSNNH